jgi:hypothetical protein
VQANNDFFVDRWRGNGRNWKRLAKTLFQPFTFFSLLLEEKIVIFGRGMTQPQRAVMEQDFEI